MLIELFLNRKNNEFSSCKIINNYDNSTNNSTVNYNIYTNINPIDYKEGTQLIYSPNISIMVLKIKENVPDLFIIQQTISTNDYDVFVYYNKNTYNKMHLSLKKLKKNFQMFEIKIFDPMKF